MDKKFPWTFPMFLNDSNELLWKVLIKLNQIQWLFLTDFKYNFPLSILYCHALVWNHYLRSIVWIFNYFKWTFYSYNLGSAKKTNHKSYLKKIFFRWNLDFFLPLCSGNHWIMPIHQWPPMYKCCIITH